MSTRYLPTHPTQTYTGAPFEFATGAALWIVGRKDAHQWTIRAVSDLEPLVFGSPEYVREAHLFTAGKPSRLEGIT